MFKPAQHGLLPLHEGWTDMNQSDSRATTGTSVGHTEVDVVVLAQRLHAIARHACRRIDDANPPAGKHVEQRTLADIGTTDNGNDR